MADDDGMESFEINDFDLQSALNPGRRPRITKEQQIYGMWAEKDSDDEEDFGRRGFSGFGGKKKKDYSAPVSFISGGVKVGDKISQVKQEKEEQNEGFVPYPKGETEDPLRIGGSFGKRSSKQKKQTETPIINEAEFAGLRRGPKGPIQTGKDFGDWEKYTRGIGSKLLEKMGYKQGKGLGKEGEGIVKPVEAKLRPGRGAVGAYGAEVKGPKIPRRNLNQLIALFTFVPQEKVARLFHARHQSSAEQKASSRDGVVEEELEEEEGEDAEDRRPTGQWRREGGRRKAKYKYRTIDEVIADGGALGKRIMVGTEHSSTKVIDMTGKEQKVYTGYTVLASKKREAETDAKGGRKFDVPELTYNLDLLVDLTEEEIIRNNRQLSFLKDQNVALRHEIGELKSSVINENDQQDRVKEVLAMVERFAAKGKHEELSLEDCSELFEKLQRDYYQEYKMFGLSDIATTNVLPLIRNAFDGWDPLNEPEHCASLMKEWRDILEDRNFRGGKAIPGEEMDPYHKGFIH